MSINYRGLSIPHTRMGARVTSDNLFDPNEQVIFDFYEANKNRYRRAVDIGANIGVHSILMARLGWQVRAYEPDPVHFARLLENVASHGIGGQVAATEAAVSNRDEETLFVRVLDNTTSSHLAGAKASYGPREYFQVKVLNCRPLFEWADFAKIDCEGHEAVLVGAIASKAWAALDALLEVGTAANARKIYYRLRGTVPLWAQKIGWRRVQSMADMPTCHQDGSLFIGRNPPFGGRSE